MAGYSRVIVVATEEHDNWGVLEVNPQMMLLIGEGNRQWVEARYFSEEPEKPSHRLNMVPEGPDHPNMLIDACLLFMPWVFAECPSFKRAQEQMRGVPFLDFNAGTDAIPEAWADWREEARPRFDQLVIRIMRVDNRTTFVPASAVQSLHDDLLVER